MVDNKLNWYLGLPSIYMAGCKDCCKPYYNIYHRDLFTTSKLVLVIIVSEI
jgi:hypothetical protein